MLHVLVWEDNLAGKDVLKALGVPG